MLTAIKQNPFNTTHFGWIDINLLSKHPSNSLNYIHPDVFGRIKKIAANPLDRMTLMSIGCTNKDLYNDLSLYYSRPRYFFSAGFYTVDITTAFFIFPKIQEKTEDLILKGFIRGDEMVLPWIVDAHEDKFTLLLGDYQDLINNYFSIDTNGPTVGGRILREYKAAGKQELYKKVLQRYRKTDTSRTFDYNDALTRIDTPD
jgi:hypothetical protein